MGLDQTLNNAASFSINLLHSDESLRPLGTRINSAIAWIDGAASNLERTSFGARAKVNVQYFPAHFP